MKYLKLGSSVIIGEDEIPILVLKTVSKDENKEKIIKEAYIMLWDKKCFIIKENIIGSEKINVGITGLCHAYLFNYHPEQTNLSLIEVQRHQLAALAASTIMEYLSRTKQDCILPSFTYLSKRDRYRGEDEDTRIFSEFIDKVSKYLDNWE